MLSKLMTNVGFQFKMPFPSLIQLLSMLVVCGHVVVSLEMKTKN